MAALSDAEIIRAIAIGNLKSLAEQPAMLSNQAYANVVATTNLTQQNAVADQQSTNQLGVSVLAALTTLLSRLPFEGTCPPPESAPNNEPPQKQA